MDEKAWTKWSAIAEIVSSVAILITLVYLAVQTQQNTDAQLSDSRQNMFDIGQTELGFWIEYPELSVFIIDETLDMTLEEKIKLDSLMILAMQRREFAWTQYERGLLDQESWEDELNILAALVGTPRLRSWWLNVGTYGRSPGFVAEVNKLLLEEGYHPYWEALKNW